MIAVATRYSRRNKQRCWIVQVSQEQILRISGKYPEWELKLYAALFFRVINEVIAEGYEIHIDKELATERAQTKMIRYIKRLFGLHYSGQDYLENPPIITKTKQSSIYIKDADLKAGLARHKRKRIEQKNFSAEVFVRLLS